MNGFFPKGRQWFGAVFSIALAVALSAIGFHVANPPQPEPLPPVAPGSGSYGWVPDPEAVEAVAQGLRFKVFSDTPAGQVKDETLPKSVYLWEAVVKVTGKLPTPKDQKQVGSCVSFGTNSAIYRSMATDIASGRIKGELKFITEEVTYGLSRHQIGKDKIRGDGSVGAWAAEAVKQYGVVPREHIAGVDLTTYSEARCKDYGSKGPPEGVIAVAKESPVNSITQVKTWAEAKKALASGYGIAVCSDQGFSMQRDKNGVCAAQGSWGHCMCIDGYHVEGGTEYGHIVNSWGPDTHKGPVGWGSPGTDGFWAKSSVIDRMLKQDDSWAFSSAVGFPAREWDWMVFNRPERGGQGGGKNHAVHPMLAVPFALVR